MDKAKSHLVTFDDLLSRQDIDVIGGFIEVNIQTTTLRGVLLDILWWNHYPRRFVWISGQVWDDQKCLWEEVRTDACYFDFGFDCIEQFAGPIECESGELFFTLSGRIAMTIFPKGCHSSVKPECDGRFQLLRQCFV